VASPVAIASIPQSPTLRRGTARTKRPSGPQGIRGAALPLKRHRDEGDLAGADLGARCRGPPCSLEDDTQPGLPGVGIRPKRLGPDVDALAGPKKSRRSSRREIVRRGPAQGRKRLGFDPRGRTTRTPGTPAIPNALQGFVNGKDVLGGLRFRLSPRTPPSGEPCVPDSTSRGKTTPSHRSRPGVRPMAHRRRTAPSCSHRPGKWRRTLDAAGFAGNAIVTSTARRVSRARSSDGRASA